MFKKISDIFKTKSISTNYRPAVDGIPVPYVGEEFNPYEYKSYHKQLEAYSKVPPVKAVIKRISDDTSNIPLRVENENGEVLENHWLYRLWDDPHPILTWKSIRRKWILNFLINGNGYLLSDGGVTGNPVRLYCVDPGQIQPNWSQGTLWYNYKVHNFVYGPPQGKYLPESVIHIRQESPNNDIIGGSPLVPLASTIEKYWGSDLWNVTTLSQYSKLPPAVFTTKQAPSAETRKEIQEQFDRDMQKRRPVVTWGGLEFNEISGSAKDLDFTGSNAEAFRMIAAVYQIDPRIVTMPNGGLNFSSDFIGILTNYFNTTIKNIVDDEAETLTKYLLSKEKNRIVADMSEVKAIVESQVKAMAAMQGVTSLTVNEKRRVAGYPAIDDGKADEIFYPAGMVTGSEAAMFGEEGVEGIDDV